MTIVADRDYFFCEYCNSFAFPRPSSDGVVPLGEENDVPCPVCSAELVTASVAGTRVLHCPGCRGILVSQEAFSLIVKLLRARATGEPEPIRAVKREELKREIVCPYCGQTMHTHPYYGPGTVVIDNCSDCGVVWLDPGELAGIRDAPGRDRGRADLDDYSLIDILLGE